MKPGDSISIRVGDTSHASFWHQHCVKVVSSRVLTWCGLELPTTDVIPAVRREPVCRECRANILNWEEVST